MHAVTFATLIVFSVRSIIHNRVLMDVYRQIALTCQGKINKMNVFGVVY